MVQPVRLADHFADLLPWTPVLAAELNGQHVRLARMQGEFTWHSHAEQDELFLVLEGAFELHLRDRVLALAPGELVVVPRGVEHKPVAPAGCVVLLFEPAETVNTGAAQDERTLAPAALRRLGGG